MTTIRPPAHALRPSRVRPRATGVLLMAVIAGGALVLSACGGGGGAKPSPADDAAEFGLPEAEIDRRQVAVENRIRDCMKAQGFEYVPVAPAALRAAMNSNSKPSGLSDKEFRAQYGYGISTLYEQQLKQAQASVSQPNRRIRDALSAADRAAYDRALYGDNPAATFAVALDSEDLSILGGYSKQAADAVFPAAEIRRLVLNNQDAVGERVAQDPRVIEATKAWTACLQAAGFQFAKPDDIETYLRDKLTAIVGGAPTVASANADPGTGPGYDASALAALQQEELAIARADGPCNERHLKPVTDKVEAEYTKSQGQG